MKHERMIITTAISMWEREDHINVSRLFCDLQQQRQNVKQKLECNLEDSFPTSLKHLRRYKLSRMKEENTTVIFEICIPQFKAKRSTCLYTYKSTINYSLFTKY